MSPKKKRSFRISEVQADVVKFALLFLMSHANERQEPLFHAYNKSAEALYTKLENYDWEIET